MIRATWPNLVGADMLAEVEIPHYHGKVTDKMFKDYGNKSIEEIRQEENISDDFFNYYCSLVLLNPFFFNKSNERCYLYLVLTAIKVHDKIKNDKTYGLDVTDMLSSLKTLSKYSDKTVNMQGEEYHIWRVLVELLEHSLLKR